MSITLTCRCKSRLQVKDHLAGKLIQCPRCGENLMVPRPETSSSTAEDEDDSYELAPAAELPVNQPACPSCGADLPSGAVLCVKCGYHLVLGKHMGEQTAPPSPSAPARGSAPSHGNKVADLSDDA